MLINEIKQKLQEARKNKNQISLTIFTTLYSEASNVGKTKRNGDSTDEEVISVLKKFKEGVEELRKYRNLTEIEEQELEVYESFLPKQLSEEELREIISDILEKIGEKSPKRFGLVMNQLKTDYFGRFDGKVASQIVKSLVQLSFCYD